MVTREKYLKALEIVDLYHRKNRTSIDDLIFKLDVSIRLKNSVRAYRLKNPEAVFLDEINLKQIRRYRNFGRNGYLELKELIK